MEFVLRRLVRTAPEGQCIDMNHMPTENPLRNQRSAATAEGYTRAVALLNDCSTDQGFLASPTARDNYRRIWAPDGVIMGLAALMDGHPDLVETFRHTPLTLAHHRGPHGEIPSNIDPGTDRASFGGSAGRIDGDLWFVIGCGQIWRVTGDEDVLNRVLPVIERVRYLLGAWEYRDAVAPPQGQASSR
jgi:glycogen debranching enzyme